MSINPASRPPHPSAPKSRPATTASRTSAHFLPSHLSPEHSRSSSRVRQTRKHSASSIQKDVSNGKNDKATAALIRRVLIPQTPTGHGSDPSLTRERGTPQPLEELLPPLTSSNEVDLQLYALIAIVIKEFVHAWYSKITPDTAFTEEVIQIIAHCTRALEQRLRKVDIYALLLDEVPALIETHILGEDRCCLLYGCGTNHADLDLQHTAPPFLVHWLPAHQPSSAPSTTRSIPIGLCLPCRMGMILPPSRSRRKTRRRIVNYWRKVSWPCSSRRRTWRISAFGPWLATSWPIYSSGRLSAINSAKHGSYGRQS